MEQLVIKTNKYLRDADVRARMVFRSARSSSAIEGIRDAFESDVVKAAIHEKGEPAKFPGPRVKKA